MTKLSTQWTGASRKTSWFSPNQEKRFSFPTFSTWKHKKLSPYLRMLRRLIRFKTLQRLGIGVAFVFLTSFWLLQEPQTYPIFPPTLKPTPIPFIEEIFTILPAAPKSNETQESGPLHEIRPNRKKEPVSKYVNSPLNWIDSKTITDGEEDDITIVTAFINLGRYIGKGNLRFIPDEYRRWMKVFGNIKNPVIAFMNDKNDLALFTKIREGLPGSKSQVELVSKQTLWGFDLSPNMATLLKRKENRNVTKPAGYIAVRHSKYDFVWTALKYDYFKTKFYCWLDMDLFKDIVNTTKQPFSLYVPKNFDENKIAYSEQATHKNFSIPVIFQQNKRWVSGSTFLGRASKMKEMVKQYAVYTELYMNKTYVNTDTQVVYAMYQNNKKLPISIQTYPPTAKYKPGEQLGYLMLEAGAKRKKH